LKEYLAGLDPHEAELLLAVNEILATEEYTPPRILSFQYLFIRIDDKPSVKLGIFGAGWDNRHCIELIFVNVCLW
jgi:hypothetical protein